MIQVNGDPLNWNPGMTIGDVIKIKNYIFPMIVVTINGLHVRPSEYKTTIVSDESIIQVIHLISGG